MPDRALLKQEAKGILRGASVSPYLFTLVVLVISFVIGRVSDYVQWDTATRAAYEARLGIDLSFLPFCHAPFPGAVTLFVAILCSLLSVILSAGVILYRHPPRRGSPHRDALRRVFLRGEDHPALYRDGDLHHAVVDAAVLPRHHRGLPLPLRDV